LLPIVAFAAGVSAARTAWCSAIAAAVLDLGLVCAFLLYEPLALARWGTTVGKAVMDLHVRGAASPSAPLSTGRAIGRAACYPLGAGLVTLVIPLAVWRTTLVLLIGYAWYLLNVLWLLWDRPLKQCLHDKIAGTIVVEDVVATRALCALRASRRAMQGAGAPSQPYGSSA
jgi:uncharacterized RDD family membrane protein YckC